MGGRGEAQRKYTGEGEGVGDIPYLHLLWEFDYFSNLMGPQIGQFIYHVQGKGNHSVLTSDIGGKTVLVLVHSLLMP